jgi:hypothetical protein
MIKKTIIFNFNEFKKKTLPKKKFKQKKKLKIGVKLQKNLDKNKFGLVKKLLTNKSVLLSNKKVLLVDKKSVEWRRKNRTLPNTITHLRYNIPHTQRNITKRDVAQKTTSPHINLFYTLTIQKCI